MLWKGGRRSSNVEDRRGRGGMGMGMAGGGIGLLILVVLGLLFGINPGDLMQGGETGPLPPQQTAPSASEQAPPPDEMGQFVSVVLGSTEDAWNEKFSQAGRDYPEPRLVLFSGMVQSACGMAGSAVGPFYCPRDGSVYIDLNFYRDLRERFGADGDFAQAYVIAHEVGHHVQNVLGVMERMQPGTTGEGSTAVRVELQADCLAGVWGHHARQRNLLEEGDFEEAMNAASAIGDDRIQQKTQGQVVPESFTHGSSEQRQRWFRRGFESGDLKQCDTFASGTL
ncbi:MAG: KPN_02809 family neutral zinc metallopeptidase [Longimicrobiales bacterium]